MIIIEVLCSSIRSKTRTVLILLEVFIIKYDGIDLCVEQNNEGEEWNQWECSSECIGSSLVLVPVI